VGGVKSHSQDEGADSTSVGKALCVPWIFSIPRASGSPLHLEIGVGFRRALDRRHASVTLVNLSSTWPTLDRCIYDFIAWPVWVML
jgi:hypothetical protein